MEKKRFWNFKLNFQLVDWLKTTWKHFHSISCWLQMWILVHNIFVRQFLGTHFLQKMDHKKLNGDP